MVPGTARPGTSARLLDKPAGRQGPDHEGFEGLIESMLDKGNAAPFAEPGELLVVLGKRERT